MTRQLVFGDLIYRFYSMVECAMGSFLFLRPVILILVVVKIPDNIGSLELVSV